MKFTKQAQPVRRYMTGFDGLRTLAVLAVIAYHLHLDFAPGGLLGVGVFFVLSGYLITDILADQWRRNGRLDLKDFWIRRARRLLPAMLVMICGVLVWVTLFQPTLLNKLSGDVKASLLYVMNWWFVYHEVSYFESFGPPSPLGNLWSLAVEEQFYLIWPLLFAFGLRYFPQRGKLIGFTVAAIVGSALAMALLYEPGSDPSRVYYGTDTRAFSLLIGAALAMVWPSQKLTAQISAKARLSLDLTGTIALGILIFMVWKTNEYDTFLYRGGMVILSLSAAVVVAVLAHPASRLGILMGTKPLRWLGVRSYGIYLWHYPVIVLTSPNVHTGGLDIPLAVFQVGVTLVLAALSYRFVEEPIRTGAVGKLWTRLISGGERIHKLPSRRTWMNSAFGLLVLVVTSSCTPYLFPTTTASVGSSIPPIESISPSGRPCGPDNGKTDNHVLPVIGKPTDHNGNSQSMITPEPQGHPQKQPDPVTSAPIPTPVPTPKPTPLDPVLSGAGKGITILGDSVVIGAQRFLEEQLPGIRIDGKIGRQMSHAADLIKQLKAEEKLGQHIILELGTNGPFPKKQLESLLHLLEGAEHITIINIRVPRPWEDEVNSTIAEVVSEQPHVTLIDWYSASADHNSYFYADGVHLTPEGAQQYASLLLDSIQP